jgi:4,5-dihydroxyphthalate decarboxylase
MRSIDLTYAGLSYFDRTIALESGEVQPKGIDLKFTRFEVTGELFKRQRKFAEFESSEMSLSNFIMMTAQGDQRFVGLPIFLSRQFRHKDVYVHANSGVETADQLKGQKVGVLQYQMTAAVWVRAILEHDHGVSPMDINWWTGGLNKPGVPGGDIGADYQAEIDDLKRRIPGLSLSMIPVDRTLEEMLESASLTALVTSRAPAAFKEGSAAIRRLFRDYRKVEQDFYRRTGLFPIMHLVVIRRDVYERDPWIAVSLSEAFAAAKRRGSQRLRSLGTLAVTLPWLAADLDEIDDLFAGDAFPYGLPRNRTVLETTIRYLFEQGLVDRQVGVEELFAAETLDLGSFP